MGYQSIGVQLDSAQAPGFPLLQTAFCKATALQSPDSEHHVTDLDLFFACFNHVVKDLPASDRSALFRGIHFDTVRSNLHVRVEPKKSWAYFYIGPISDFSAVPDGKEKLDKILVKAVAMYLLAVENLEDYFDTATHQLTHSFQKNYPNAEHPRVMQLIQLVQTMY